MQIILCDLNNVSDEELHQWYFDMSLQRREKCRRIQKETAQRSCIAADHLARTALSEYSGISPQEIEISVSDHGKPFLKDNPIFFSYSHSQSMVACVLSDRPVGIDIERIRPIDTALQKRICTHREWSYLLASKDEEERTFRFFQLWTRKEAIFKIHGIPPRDDRNTEVICPREDVLFTERQEGDFLLSTAELISR